MARDYTLKDSATTRKAVLDAVLASCFKFSTGSSDEGVSVSIGYEKEALSKYESLIGKLSSAVPLSEISELKSWQEDMEERSQTSNLRSQGYFAARAYRDRLVTAADTILLSETVPTSEMLQILAAKAAESGLFAEGVGTLTDIRELCKVFTPLHESVALLIGHLVHYESADASHKPYFADLMWRGWNTHRRAKVKDHRLKEPIGFEYDMVPEVLFSGMRFLFTGKFAFGTRKKCANEVAARGGEIVENPNRWIDFLVVSEGEENASPYSSKAGYCLNARSMGWPCLVITEQLWVQSLTRVQTLPTT